MGATIPKAENQSEPEHGDSQQFSNQSKTENAWKDQKMEEEEEEDSDFGKIWNKLTDQ